MAEAPLAARDLYPNRALQSSWRRRRERPSGLGSLCWMCSGVRAIARVVGRRTAPRQERRRTMAEAAPCCP